MWFSGERGHLVYPYDVLEQEREENSFDVLEFNIREALNNDDETAYLAALKWRIPGGPKANQIEFLISRVEELCHYNSPKCASALLDWEINGSKVDFNAPLSDNTYLMHGVADRYSIVMLESMLQRGASANVRTFKRNPEDGNDLLPLNVALDSLSFHIYLADWTPKDSVMKLIILLCLPQMKTFLNFIKLLAVNTADTCVELRKYAEEGSLIQMAAALLTVAQEKIMRGPTASFERDNDRESCKNGLMWLHYELQNKIGSLFHEENNMNGVAGSSEKIEKCKDARIRMISSLRLLEVFERAGDAIDECLRIHQNTWVSKDMVAHHVASLLRKAGYHLNKADTDLSNIRWIKIDDCNTVQTKSEESIDDGSTFQTKSEESKSTNGFCPLHNLDFLGTHTRSENQRRTGWVRTEFIPVPEPTLTSNPGTRNFRLQGIPEYKNVMARISEYKAMKTGTAMKFGSPQGTSSYSTLALALKKYARCRG